MGRPKLLLKVGGQTVIRRLLAVLDRPEITDTLVVIRPDDEALAAEVAATGATIVRPPVPPPEMRESVEHAVAEIARRHQPRPDDGWLLIPADHPLISAALLDELIQAWRTHRPRILIPVAAGRRGHPVFFFWSLADQVPAIPPERGLNWLVKANASDVLEHPVRDPAPLLDMDDPTDYERILRATAGQPPIQE